MDGCEDTSSKFGRLQTKDVGWSTEIATRLFYIGYVCPFPTYHLLFEWLIVIRRVGEKSPETEALRKKVSEGCEKLVWEFFESGGQVVIYDANNGARDAREALAKKFDAKGIHIIFLGASNFCIAWFRN